MYGHAPPIPAAGHIPTTPDATRPQKTVISIYECDTAKQLVPGRNPIKIAETSIPYEVRLPRRTAAAIEAVKQIVREREPTIAHAKDGSIVATVFVRPPAAG